MAYEPKTKQSADGLAGVEAFLDGVPNPRRREDGHTLVAMMRDVTGEEPAMWGPTIIGFGQYRYVYDSGHSGVSPRIGFSPRKANLVLYIGATAADSAPLLAKLGKHKTGKGCLYINQLADVNLGVLRELTKAGLTYMDAKYPQEP